MSSFPKTLLKKIQASSNADHPVEFLFGHFFSKKISLNVFVRDFVLRRVGKSDMEGVKILTVHRTVSLSSA